MDNLLEGLAPHFLHVSYVVRDLDAARESFKRMMGVTPSAWRQGIRSPG